MLNLLAPPSLLFALLSSTVIAAPLHPYDMSCTPNTPTVGKAIYITTNDAENAVVALAIGSDGLLSKSSVTKTGGMGSNAITAATGEKAAPDALLGQSALTVVGKHIFAVNAGSNTLTMLSISSDNPTSLTPLGTPMPLPGDFPNTVSASSEHRLVCVGTTGAVAGISCAKFSNHGLGEMDALRPFDLGQTTPPMGPLNTISQTFFSADESVLYTTVKGDPNVNNTGFLSVFPVEQTGDSAACLSMTGTRSSPAGTAVLFGSDVLPDDPSKIFVTDASFGAAILSVSPNGTASTFAKQSIEGQMATCWATISPATKSAYVTDVAVNRLIAMSLEDASILGELDLSENMDSGLIDLEAAGNYVYALAPGNGTTDAAITVVDVSGGQGMMEMVQHFSLEGLAGMNAQGMAVLM